VITAAYNGPGSIQKRLASVSRQCTEDPGATLWPCALTYNSGEHSLTAVAVADVNGDCKPDLLVATSMWTAPEPEMPPQVRYWVMVMEPSAVAVAGVNRDVKANLVVANYSGQYGRCANG
jgi:hypothetical protein